MVGCCGGTSKNIQSQMYIGPYLTQNAINASILNPRIKPYGGWASYKNVKSGNYNRQVCWNCSDFVGFPQTPGFTDLNIVDTPQALPDYPKMEIADQNYIRYQQERMKTWNETRGSNYLNSTCNLKYPKRYVKGNWPDEQLVFTNTPRGF